MRRLSPHLSIASAIIISNVWLLDDGKGGRFLFDTGYFTDLLPLKASLWSAGVRGPGDLTAAILTHRHSDHAANANWIRKQFGCPIACHRADAEVLTGAKAPPLLDRETSRFYQRALCVLEDHFPAKTEIDFAFEAGVWKWGFQIFHTPGHTEGSSIIYHEPTKTVFSGDSIVAGIPPFRFFEYIHLAVRGFSLDMEHCHQATKEFIREMPKIESLCSGHGPLINEQTENKIKKLLEPDTRYLRTFL